MWIEKEEKKYYLDACKYRGIVLKFAKSLNKETVEQITTFIKYLKKLYFFPIKVNIKFSDLERYKDSKDGHIFYAIFFDNEDEKPRRYPEIYIATKIGKHNPIEDVYFSIAHMLTCYYQWFFKQEDRSHRSLEIEANRWAEYIYHSYLEYKTLK